MKTPTRKDAADLLALVEFITTQPGFATMDAHARSGMRSVLRFAREELSKPESFRAEGEHAPASEVEVGAIAALSSEQQVSIKQKTTAQPSVPYNGEKGGIARRDLRSSLERFVERT
jgi:hypothetical protein